MTVQGLNYVVSSAFYFEKAAVAASGLSSSASRTALFACINGASAAIIGIVQVSPLQERGTFLIVKSLSEYAERCLLCRCSGLFVGTPKQSRRS